MISYKHKFIFVQIPKTGCSSAERKLMEFGEKTTPHLCSLASPVACPKVRHDIIYKHANVNDLKKYTSSQFFEDCFKFTFVRNPYSWLVSNYFFWSRGIHGCYLNHLNKQYFSLHRVIEDFKLDSMSFKDWVKWYIVNVCGTQFEMIVNEQNEMSLDFIGKLENFQEDFNIVCDKIGIPRQELPHENKTNHKHYTEYYDDKTLDIVAKKYAKDIDYFEYEFGE
jgi:hypothetical protein